MLDSPEPNKAVAGKKTVSGAAPIFGERRILFHIGAHKTATTYIQGILKKNNAALLQQGVLYIPLGEMRRKGLTKAIVEVSKSTRKRDTLTELRKEILEGYDAKLVEKCHTIVISEENFSAVPITFLEGNVYSDLGDKLKHVRDELGPNMHVFFSIRDYPDFISSIYVEVLRHHPYTDFGKFLTGLYDEAPGLWLEAWRTLSRSFGAENVTFWDFRDTVNHPQKVLSMLTGGNRTFEIDPSPVRESLSQRSIEFLRDFYKLPGGPLPANIVSKIANRLYPLSKLNGKFDPWTPRERAYLHQVYETEKAAMPVKTFGS